MNKTELIHELRKKDREGKFVFNLYALHRMFPADSRKTLLEGLNRHIKAGLIVRACRGIYVNEQAGSFDSYIIEHIAKALRPGEYSYVSLESILSEYGLISQIPIDRLTVMTTGRSGVYKTAYGVIEFVHTKRSIPDIIDGMQSVPGRPLRIAKMSSAIRDLKRVGRNVDLLTSEGVSE